MAHEIPTGSGKHIDHAQNRIRGVCAVQCRQYQMPCLRQTQCQFNARQVAQFTEQNHIGIAAQNIAQSTVVVGKMLAQFALMHQAFAMRKLVFNRIFNRDGVCGMLRLSGIEPAGERGRFATAGGACDQNQALREW